MMQVVVIVGVIALIVVGSILGYLSAQKRRQAMADLAGRLGLRFSPHRNRELARQYDFLNKLRAGHDRYAYNTLSGHYQGHKVLVFDYHYTTGSGKNTQHHHFSFFVLHLPAAFPELTIAPEGFFSKIAQAVGYDDIDFESHEFSRRFCVRCPNKKFAYDVCNAQMIEYLLANGDLTIEIDDDALAISFSARLAPERIESNLNRLVALRSLLPDYLFARR
jgi:Tfp pilus assembly protein PilE